MSIIDFVVSIGIVREHSIAISIILESRYIININPLKANIN